MTLRSVVCTSLAALVGCAAPAPRAGAPSSWGGLAPGSIDGGQLVAPPDAALPALGPAASRLVGVGGAPPPPAEAPADAAPASSNAAIATPSDASAASTQAYSASACNEQVPQDFLVRGNYLKVPTGNERAIQYRTDQYGYVKGYGHPSHDSKPALDSVVGTTFMGLKVRMHRKVIPALRCAEEEIASACSAHPYKPHALAGIRDHNTYRGGEVTNHAFGIAIDVDPAENSCCGCVAPWNDAPLCKRPAKTEYDRMVMPECWVHAFERFGFYWLGHDRLRDTMHFEFLGDPDRILKSQGAGADR